jgi:hypothetical protein
LPKWAAEMWNIPVSYRNVLSKKNILSQVQIIFKGKIYAGNQYTKKKAPDRRKIQYYLSFSKELHRELKQTFRMSYLRSIEMDLGGDAAEKNSPFWEFLDIEFNDKDKVYIFNAHYIQESFFPKLFDSLVDSHAIEKIEYDLKKKKPRIIKQDWRDKRKLSKEFNIENVIYTLLDTKNKEIYIGETDNFKGRFANERIEISGWDYYRIDILPDELRPFRVDIERMIIRMMAGLLKNKKDIPSKEISDYQIVNIKIDKSNNIS